MKKTAPATSWIHFQQSFLRYSQPEISLDYSLISFTPDFFGKMAKKANAAFAAMDRLEAGDLANVDEKRMVGHYWLRHADLAPHKEQRKCIEKDIQSALKFAAAVHGGKVRTPGKKSFTDVLVIGIGGSALGPQLIADALGDTDDKMQMHFFDNTDPEGMDRALRRIGDRLTTTLTVVISKSGGTPETRNGMLVAKTAYERRKLKFGDHAIAITGEGSKMDLYAKEHGFLRIFPMQDWVGGRTSVMHTVGLVPMALQGVDVHDLLLGAREMDKHTRQKEVRNNMAMMLALVWHSTGGGHGRKDMVILPYKDRLVLFSKYLQQLVMESLGKEHDLSGKQVHQGIAVYGNKGSTDQHAYVQQLRDGLNNFFATFIEVRRAAAYKQVEVDSGVTSGDYLQGFLRGTRRALADSGRESVTISVPKVTAYYLGALIALFERAVGFYASLVGINAYHQPGVEAGKKAAAEFLELLGRVRNALGTKAQTAEAIAKALKADTEDVYHALNHLAANEKKVKSAQGEGAGQDTFWVKKL